MTAEIIHPMFVQRMICTSCGAEANASCNCGKPYVPKAERAVEIAKADPEKSLRTIAREVGGTPEGVRKALKAAGVNRLTPIQGEDGKSYPSRRTIIAEEMPTEEEAEESWQHDVYDQACLLLERMADATRARFIAHVKRTYGL